MTEAPERIWSWPYSTATGVTAWGSGNWRAAPWRPLDNKKGPTGTEYIRLDAHEAAVAAARKDALAVMRGAGDDVVRASNTLMLMLVGEVAMTKPALEAAIRRTLDARNAWDNVFKDASK